MTGFTFDAKAALDRARNRSARPNPPNRPNRSASGGAGLGGLGRLGTVRGSGPEMTPYELALDLYHERAAIREFLGGQDRYTSMNLRRGADRLDAVLNGRKPTVGHHYITQRGNVHLTIDIAPARAEYETPEDVVGAKPEGGALQRCASTEPPAQRETKVMRCVLSERPFFPNFCLVGADSQFRVGQRVTTPRRRFLRKSGPDSLILKCSMASMLVRHGAKISTFGNMVGLFMQRAERD